MKIIYDEALRIDPQRRDAYLRYNIEVLDAARGAKELTRQARRLLCGVPPVNGTHEDRYVQDVLAFLSQVEQTLNRLIDRAEPNDCSVGNAAANPTIQLDCWYEKVQADRDER